MKFACDSAVLREAIGYVSHSIMGKCTLPVLECIAMDARNNSVRLCTTNLDSYTIVQIPADVASEGSACVSGKTLRKFVAGDGVIEFETDNATRTLRAGLGLESLETPFLPTEDFPEFDPHTIETGQPVVLDALQFMRDVRLVAHVASTEESRPTLKCVQIRNGGDKLHYAATDGFRLLVVNQNDATEEYLIYSSLLLSLTKIIDSSKTMSVSLSFGKDKSLVSLTSASGLKVTHCITHVDARFPDWRGVVHKSSNVEIVVDAEKLKLAAEMALVYSRENANIVTLSLCADGRLSVVGAAAVLGASNGSLSPVSCSGNLLEWSCNGEYLVAYLKQFGPGNVSMSFTKRERPAMIKPVASAEKSEHYFVMMPMTPK